MKTATLVCYTLGSNATSVQRNKLRKQLLGYKDYSNKSQYTYFREGLLTDLPSIRLIRSVFIVKNEDVERVLELLQRYGAKIFVKKVILTKEDCEKLGL